MRTFTDVTRSADFYASLFGFEPARVDGGARLRLGEMVLDLRQAQSGAVAAAPPANDRGFRHFAIVVRDMGEAFKKLEAANVELISTAPQTLPAWNKAAAGIEALYFRDPDGHPVELIRFPAGKGKAEWRRPGNDLFPGVDHTAIVVADTAESLRFYRDQLGFEFAGESRNFGPEQDALSGVRDCSVLVTSLAAREGAFGLELLEYILPKNGRPLPRDVGPGDLRWSETLIAADAPSPIAGAQFRDPDGYGVRSHERMAAFTYRPVAGRCSCDPDCDQYTARKGAGKTSTSPQQ